MIASSVRDGDCKITPTALRSPENQYAASVRLRGCTHSHGDWSSRSGRAGG
ncbi:hypothetical protein ACWC0C_27060 [Streptomyces sp. NPDC001709]